MGSDQRKLVFDPLARARIVSDAVEETRGGFVEVAEHGCLGPISEHPQQQAFW